MQREVASTLRLVQRTTWTSIVVQFVTGVILVYALLSFRVPPEQRILRHILMLEAAVQAIELVFYLVVVRTLSSHASVKTMAAKRYADWVITTPVMLVTLSAYFTYEGAGDKTKLTLSSFLAANRSDLMVLVLGNLLMLAFGFLGEVGRMPLVFATTLGFVGFLIAFRVLHSFAERAGAFGLTIFWVVATIWATYGVVYVLPSHLKNSAYNFLDLFAKNFFGLYLSWKLSTVAQSNPAS
jgi:bacteriorhodopsin